MALTQDDHIHQQTDKCLEGKHVAFESLAVWLFRTVRQGSEIVWKTELDTDIIFHLYLAVRHVFFVFSELIRQSCPDAWLWWWPTWNPRIRFLSVSPA